MIPRQLTTHLDKDAHKLLPGLLYAQALIEIAIQMSRHNSLREATKPHAIGSSQVKN
jgi:hypothetical protein